MSIKCLCFFFSVFKIISAKAFTWEPWELEVNFWASLRVLKTFFQYPTLFVGLPSSKNPGNLLSLQNSGLLFETLAYISVWMFPFEGKNCGIPKYTDMHLFFNHKTETALSSERACVLWTKGPQVESPDSIGRSSSLNLHRSQSQ